MAALLGLLGLETEGLTLTDWAPPWSGNGPGSVKRLADCSSGKPGTPAQTGERLDPIRRDIYKYP